MVNFEAEMERFGPKGEKTGWTVIQVPKGIAEQLKPGYRKSFRVKGMLDGVPIGGVALVPMGEGDFILALKSSLRKQLKKEEGAVLMASLEEDLEFKLEIPVEIETCLGDEPRLLDNFLRLPMSHRNYFINWFNSAKTEQTRVKRLTMIVKAMDQQLDFGEMIRAEKASKA